MPPSNSLQRGSLKNGTTTNAKKLPKECASDWSSRQVAAAHDEDTSITESFRQELEQTKARECAIVMESNRRFVCTSSVQALPIEEPTITHDISLYYDEDMPMDELADIVRMKQKARIDKSEQQRLDDDLQLGSHQQVAQLQSEREQLRIEKERLDEEHQRAMRERDMELEKLRQDATRFELEKQHFQKIQQQQAEASQNQSQLLASSRLTTPSESCHSTPSRTHRGVPAFRTLRTVSHDQNSVDPASIALVGSTSSLSEDDVSPTSVISNPILRMRLDFSKQRRQDDVLQKEQQSAFIQKLATAIDVLVFRSRPVEDQYIDLSDEERSLVQRIKFGLHATQKKQRSQISKLEISLKKAQNDLQDEAAKRSVISKEASDYQCQVNNMEVEIRRLQTAAKKQFNSDDKLRKSQEQCNALKHKQVEMQEDHNAALSDIQRVLRNVTSDFEAEIEEMSTQIVKLSSENDELKNKLDVQQSFDAEQARIKVHRLQEELEINTNTKIEFEKELSAVHSTLENSMTKSNELMCEVKLKSETITKLESECYQLRENLKRYPHEHQKQTEANPEHKLQAGNELTKLRDASAQLKKKDEVIEQLEKCNHDLEAMKMNLLAEIAEQKNVVLSIKKEKEKFETDMAQYDTGLVPQMQSIIQITKERNELQKALKEMTTEAERFAKDLHEMQLQDVMTKDLIQSAREMHIREKKMEEELSGLRDELETAMKAAGVLTQALELKSEELAEVKRRMALLENDRAEALSKEHTSQATRDQQSKQKDAQILEEKMRVETLKKYSAEDAAKTKKEQEVKRKGAPTSELAEKLEALVASRDEAVSEARIIIAKIESECEHLLNKKDGANEGGLYSVLKEKVDHVAQYAIKADKRLSVIESLGAEINVLIVQINKVDGSVRQSESSEDEMSYLRKKLENAEAAHRAVLTRLHEQARIHTQLKTAINRLSDINSSKHSLNQAVDQLMEIMNSIQITPPTEGDKSALWIQPTRPNETFESKRKLLATENDKEEIVVRLKTEIAEKAARVRDLETMLTEQREESKTRMISTKESSNIQNEDLSQLQTELSQIKAEFGEKDSLVKTLEEKLKLLQEENDRMFESMKKLKNEQDGDLVVLHTELKRHQENYSSNLNLLARKEEELRVLRENLKEATMGYISDDGSDDSESMAYDKTKKGIGATAMNASIDGIDVIFNNNANDSSLKSELEIMTKLKESAEMDARINSESLANAKMIISSLEKSNKTMMHDLRSRLQDSNEAIVSLLDQTKKQEQEVTTLRSEISSLRQKMEFDARSHEEESKRYKDETLSNESKIAAQDQDIRELKDYKKKYDDMIKGLIDWVDDSDESV